MLFRCARALACSWQGPGRAAPGSTPGDTIPETRTQATFLYPGNKRCRRTRAGQRMGQMGSFPLIEKPELRERPRTHGTGRLLR